MKKLLAIQVVQQDKTMGKPSELLTVLPLKGLTGLWALAGSQ